MQRKKDQRYEQKAELGSGGIWKPLRDAQEKLNEIGETIIKK